MNQINYHHHPQDNYRPLLTQHEKIIEKYKLFLNTNNKNMQPVTSALSSSKLVNNDNRNKEFDYNNELNKKQQIDNILNNLTAKKLVQEPLKEETSKAFLNIEALKEKYLNEISNHQFRLNNTTRKILNPNEEIQRIKSKYFQKENNKALMDDELLGNKYKKYLEDELVKYQNMKIEQIKPFTIQEKEKEKDKIISEPYNEHIQMPILTEQEKDDNTLLISKMSIFESQCFNQYQQTTNSRINFSMRNETTQNNISYTYSNDNDNNNENNDYNNNNDNLDEVNYQEINSIVQRLELLKKIEDNERQKGIKEQFPLQNKENNSKRQLENEAKQIVNNVMESIPNPILTNEEDEIKAINSKRPKKTRTHKPKTKLISFEEFLDNDL